MRNWSRALVEAYPGEEFILPPFLRYGSWVGGDRDGNPFVDLAVTEETLRAHKDLILELYAQTVESLYDHLSSDGAHRLQRSVLGETCAATSSLCPRRAIGGAGPL